MHLCTILTRHRFTSNAYVVPSRHAIIAVAVLRISCLVYFSTNPNVIYVTMDLQMTEAEFFGERIVENFAAFFGIADENIRVAEYRENGRKRDATFTVIDVTVVRYESVCYTQCCNTESTACKVMVCLVLTGVVPDRQPV